MNQRYKEILTFLVDKIKNHQDSTPLVILIDGKSASGKTTFASELSERTGASVIHTDDYYRPKSPTGEIAMSDYEGNFDIKRFAFEVVEGIYSENDFEVGVFDCRKGVITETKIIPVSNTYIIEGAYSHHPCLCFKKAIKVFITAEETVRKDRILRRNGQDTLKRFETLWIPAEERYIQHYGILDKCDICIDTTSED